eukprot:gene44907-59942_t
MPLVATVYGDDQDDKSYREMQALVKAYPNLKGVISPTTIGIRAGAKAIVDGGLIGKVFITGLGLPSEMKDFVLQGACDTFAIWNPVEYGYSSTMIMINILNGAEAGPGATVSMGKKGETKVGDDGEAAMGEPFEFNNGPVGPAASRRLDGPSDIVGRPGRQKPCDTRPAIPSQAPILALTGVSKSFPGVRALNSVSFALHPGETGYTRLSGFNLMTSAKADGRHVVSVVLG